MFSIKKETAWKNWSETVVCEPEKIQYPTSISAVQAIVKTCLEHGKKLRVIGAGHSFTPLVATSEVLVSVDRIHGIESIDEAGQLVNVWAGTSLKHLGALLHECDYAMENLGDINHQTIAGAISTGTHGTGADYGSLSTQIRMLTVVTANGDIMEISPSQNPAYFQAFRISIGMLGIIVKVQLKVVKQQQLTKKSYSLSFNTCLRQLDSLRAQNRHAEFYWFPHTHTTQVKTVNLAYEHRQHAKKGSAFNEIVVENGALWALSEISRLEPRLAKNVSKACALGIPTATTTGPSHQIFVTPRLIKFREMEYSVPYEEMASVLRDIRHVIEKKKIRVHFPIECRYVKSDDIWLSPAYYRDAAYIAIHMYKGMAFQPYFDAIEEVFTYYNGRPHWGKMHSLSSESLSTVYPKWDDFLRVRQELDHEGLFLNGYLQKLFNIQ